MIVENEFTKFFFDGLKCFLTVEFPTDEDLLNMTQVELTAARPYEPRIRLHSRVVHTRTDQELETWRVNLGCPPMRVVKKTLEATTQLVKTVEAETREIMRDHYKARLYPLRPHRLNEWMAMDTFQSTVTSVRGYKYFQLFSMIESNYDSIQLMRKKSQVKSGLQDFIRTVGAPTGIIFDNAKEQIGAGVTDVCRHAYVETHTSEPHHQNQNLAERRGGEIKSATLKMMAAQNTPPTFWCFALEYIAGVRQHLAKRCLDWETPKTRLFGETADISRYRLPFWSRVWYYDPSEKFPQLKEKPGRLLGPATSSGDNFCYYVLVVSRSRSMTPAKNKNLKVLVRSVVRKREKKFPGDDFSGDNMELTFANRDGKVLEHDIESTDGDTGLDDYDYPSLTVTDENRGGLDPCDDDHLTGSASEDESNVASPQGDVQDAELTRKRKAPIGESAPDASENDDDFPSVEDTAPRSSGHYR